MDNLQQNPRVYIKKVNKAKTDFLLTSNKSDYL